MKQSEWRSNQPMNKARLVLMRACATAVEVDSTHTVRDCAMLMAALPQTRRLAELVRLRGTEKSTRTLKKLM